MGRDRSRRADPTTVRLFVAIEIPDHARSVVREAFEPWRQRFPNARWVPSENQHVTLRFLGATPAALIDLALERVAAVAVEHASPATHLSGVGAFPSTGRARVLWTGLDDRGGEIAELARALDAALAPEFEPETRAFRAHLTVARCEPALALSASFSETVLESEPFAVERLVVFRSHLQRPSPRYEAIGTAPLRSA
jgi:2'-5' RNA ligase